MGREINNLDDLLAMIGSDFNVLEEELDLDTHQAYMKAAASLLLDPQLSDLKKKCLEQPELLFDESTPEEEKKNMLIVLSHIEKPEAYRIIERFVKMDTPLKKWAVVAFQQSRVLLQSALSDDPCVFVASGLGGSGSLLRFFCVFFHRNEGLEPFQSGLLEKELCTALEKNGGKLEQIDFTLRYTTCLFLLPLQVTIPELLTSVVKECNQYGDFLYIDIVLSNVRRLADEEIMEIINHPPKGYFK